MKFSITRMLLFLFHRNIKLNASAVDAEKYLHHTNTPTSLYEKDSSATFYNPFNFSHTDFGKLILLSIDNHSSIKTVELVIQNDNKSAFVVIYYHNGQVENYIDNNVSINKKYLTPNKDWSIIENQKFIYQFEDTENGLSFLLDITIASGERIEIALKEDQSNTKKYSFLAAVGAELSEVKRFPFIYLKDAGFISRENTAVSFKVNNKEMKLTKVPVPIEGIKCYKIIYAFTPLAFFWNEERNESLSAKEMKNDKSIYQDNATYTFIEHDEHKEIKQIRYSANRHFATYTFSPPFPDMMSMKENTKVTGKFCLGIDKTHGIVCGEYLVHREKNCINMKINPKKCWQPMPSKDWVSFYFYNQKIKILEKNQFKIISRWYIGK